jgi:hypothetical protein
LTWKIERPDSNPWRASSSLLVAMPGGAAFLARFCMISAAREVVSSTLTLPFWSTIEPPAPAISELTHTVRPSYWLPCTSIDFPWRLASAIISSQVAGGVLTRSLRYQRSWVLEVNGSAQTWPLYWTVLTGPASLPAIASLPRAPVHGLIHLAPANSAVQMTSIPMMSMLESLAASRRTTSSRCWLASLGSLT